MTPPKTLTIDQTDKLLRRLLSPDLKSARLWNGRRNYCMALLILDAGLRVGELVQLLQGDLWFCDDPPEILTVRAETAKRHHERTIPLSPRLRQAIQTLRNKVWCDPICGASSFAFYNYDPTRHLTTRQVQRIITNAAQTSIGIPVNPHMLRHTFASRVLRKSNIRVTQTLLGHKSIQTTQIYTHPNSDDQKAAIAALHCEVTPQTSQTS